MGCSSNHGYPKINAETNRLLADTADLISNIVNINDRIKDANL